MMDRIFNRHSNHRLTFCTFGVVAYELKGYTAPARPRRRLGQRIAPLQNTSKHQGVGDGRGLIIVTVGVVKLWFTGAQTS